METKRYYAKVAGSTFVCSDGTVIRFFHGFADVEKKSHQNELNEILGKNPNIFVQDALPEVLPVVEQNAKSEAEIAAGNQVFRGARETGDLNDGSTLMGDVNTSTVDPALQAAVFDSRVNANANTDSAAAARIAAIRANAAAATSVSGS